MARDFEIAGRSSMTKDALIAAIRQAQESSRAQEATTKTAGKSKKEGGSSKETAKPDASAEKKSAEPRKVNTAGGRTAASAKAALASEKPSRRSSADKSGAAAEESDGGSAKSTRGLTGHTKPRSEGGRSVAKPAAEKAASVASNRGGRARSGGGKRSPKAPPAPPAPVSAKSRRIREEMRRRSQQALQNKDLSTGILVAGSAVRGGESEYTPHKDRVTLIVRDSYWLQADWEITRAAVERVRVAMNEKWHNAFPILRLMAVGDASSNRAEQLLRDIPIHGGVNTWFIDVENPPARFRVVVGYIAENDRFYPLCRSNIVETPKADAVHRLDRQWSDIAEDYERIYSLSGGYDVNSSGDLKEVFEQRLQRQMPNRKDDSLGSDTDAALDRHRALPFEVDAELIVYGSTVPGATVMLSGEPVKLRTDGTFTVRVALPDKRQVLPVIAQSRDGMKQRTTVIAVERNTKVMEAVDRDQNF